MVAVFGAALAMVAVLTGPAQAGDKDGSDAPVKTIEVAMTLQCNLLAPAALKYAVDHNHCSPDGKPVSPQGEAGGDCGKSWIYIDNRGAPGQAHFRWGLESTLGAAVWRGLHVSWYNWQSFRTGGWDDTSLMDSSTYNNKRYDHTGVGYVTTGLSGNVILWWGAICGVANPTDGTNIT